MDVAGRQFVVELRRDGVRLRDLLRLQALALEHVEEVGVAAEVELVRAVEAHAALAEEPRQHAVDDRRADLRLDVVADDREARLLEALRPVAVGVAGDEHGDAVDEAAAGGEHLLDVPLRRLFRADGQVADDDVGLRVSEEADDVVGRAGRLRDHLRQVLAEAVVGHAARDAHALAAARR